MRGSLCAKTHTNPSENHRLAAQCSTRSDLIAISGIAVVARVSRAHFAADTAAATEGVSRELASPLSTARFVCYMIPVWTLNFFARLAAFR
jgi:hypothetical protein